MYCVIGGINETQCHSLLSIKKRKDWMYFLIHNFGKIIHVSPKLLTHARETASSTSVRCEKRQPRLITFSRHLFWSSRPNTHLYLLPSSSTLLTCLPYIMVTMLPLYHKRLTKKPFTKSKLDLSK